jgi:hypothetical protein
MLCPKCKANNSDQDQFCSQCGSPLHQPSPAVPASSLAKKQDVLFFIIALLFAINALYWWIMPFIVTRFGIGWKIPQLLGMPLTLLMAAVPLALAFCVRNQLIKTAVLILGILNILSSTAHQIVNLIRY